MPWHQVRIRIAEADAASVEDALQQLGAVSVTMQDAEDEAVFQLEPGSTPLWSRTVVTGLFTEPVDRGRIESMLAGTPAQPLQADDLSMETLEDQDWERVWMDEFRPMRFGHRLWVCPSWSKPPEPDAVNIMLDPGLAFGTGTHPTTALCLEWIDGQQMQGARVIDYGCGSGILAIAAVLCGAAEVVGVDNDPQAITATASNRAMNGIAAERLQVYLPDQAPRAPADFLLANILSGPLQELTPLLAALTKPGGRIVLSGVLSTQTEELLLSYAEFFEMNAPVIQDEWVRIDGVRRP
jgi:ribosomal protein L11 methyltransferase